MRLNSSLSFSQLNIFRKGSKLSYLLKGCAIALLVLIANGGSSEAKSFGKKISYPMPGLQEQLEKESYVNSVLLIDINVFYDIYNGKGPSNIDQNDYFDIMYQNLNDYFEKYGNYGDKVAFLRYLKISDNQKFNALYITLSTLSGIEIGGDEGLKQTELDKKVNLLASNSKMNIIPVFSAKIENDSNLNSNNDHIVIDNDKPFTLLASVPLYAELKEENVQEFGQIENFDYNLKDLQNKNKRKMAEKKLEGLEIDLSQFNRLFRGDTSSFESDEDIAGYIKEKNALIERKSTITDEDEIKSIDKDIISLDDKIGTRMIKLQAEYFNKITDKINDKYPTQKDKVLLVKELETLKTAESEALISLIRGNLKKLNDDQKEYVLNFKESTYLSESDSDEFMKNYKEYEGDAIRASLRTLQGLSEEDGLTLLGIKNINYLGAFTIISAYSNEILPMFSELRQKYENKEISMSDIKDKIEEEFKKRGYWANGVFDGTEKQELFELICLYDKYEVVKSKIKDLLEYQRMMIRVNEIHNIMLLTKYLKEENLWDYLGDYNNDGKNDEGDESILSGSQFASAFKDTLRQMKMEGKESKFFESINHIFKGIGVKEEIKSMGDIVRIIKNDPTLKVRFTNELFFYIENGVDLTYILRYGKDAYKEWADYKDKFYENTVIGKAVRDLFDKGASYIIADIKRLKSENIKDESFKLKIDELNDMIDKPGFMEKLWESMSPFLTNLGFMYFAENSYLSGMGLHRNSSTIKPDLNEVSKRFVNSLEPTIGLVNGGEGGMLMFGYTYKSTYRVDKSTAVSASVSGNIGIGGLSGGNGVIPVLSLGVLHETNTDEIYKAGVQSFSDSSIKWGGSVKFGTINTVVPFVGFTLNYTEDRQSAINTKFRQMSGFVNTLFNVGLPPKTSDELVDKLKKRLTSQQLIDSILGKDNVGESGQKKNKFDDELKQGLLMAFRSEMNDQFIIDYLDELKIKLDSIGYETLSNKDRSAFLLSQQNAFLNKWLRYQVAGEKAKEVFFKLFGYEINSIGAGVNIFLAAGLAAVPGAQIALPLAFLPSIGAEKVELTHKEDEGKAAFRKATIAQGGATKVKEFSDLNDAVNFIKDYINIQGISVEKFDGKIKISAVEGDLLDILKKNGLLIYIGNDVIDGEVGFDGKNLIIGDVKIINYYNDKSPKGELKILLLGEDGLGSTLNINSDRLEIIKGNSPTAIGNIIFNQSSGTIINSQSIDAGTTLFGN